MALPGRLARIIDEELLADAQTPIQGSVPGPIEITKWLY